MIAPLICTLFFVLKRWVLLPPRKKQRSTFRVATKKTAGFHMVNKKKWMPDQKKILVVATRVGKNIENNFRYY